MCISMFSVGDLSYHIKKHQEVNQSFSETVIMNYFVQICLALQYIHRKRILHRDLKCSNEFITRNNCVKLGGILELVEC